MYVYSNFSSNRSGCRPGCLILFILAGILIFQMVKGVISLLIWASPALILIPVYFILREMGFDPLKAIRNRTTPPAATTPPDEFVDFEELESRPKTAPPEQKMSPPMPEPEIPEKQEPPKKQETPKAPEKPKNPYEDLF